MNSIFFIFEIIGVIAFSLSGALTAMKKEMDIFGACVLGMTTAIGGGIIRDLILGEDAASDFRRKRRDRIQAVEEVKEDIGPVFCLVCARTAYGRLIALFGRGAFAGFLPP